MQKHYKGNHQRAHRVKSRTKSTTSPWPWLLVGLLVGIVGATGTYGLLTGKWSFSKLRSLPKTVNTTLPENNQPLQAKKSLSLQSKEKKTAERFEFYQLLPGMEVPIPDPVTESSAPQFKLPLPPTKTVVAEKPTPPKPIQTAENKRLSPVSKPKSKSVKTELKVAAPQYLIQTGSYRTLPLAEGLKSRLISQGFSARIQKIEAEDGIWYRVILGPFPSETAALTQKTRLVKHKIHGILILQRR